MTRTIDTPAFTTAVALAKPWGHELAFADGSHGYVGKILTVRAGQALSLQYHERKDETISLIAGEALLEFGHSPEDLITRRMGAHDTVHLPPGVIHRITAVVDTVLVEASTADPGWQDDVVRLRDNYGREGTSAP